MRCECRKRAPYNKMHIQAKCTEARGRTKLLGAAHQVPAFQQGLVELTNLGRHQLPSCNPGSAHTVLIGTAPDRIPAGNVAVVAMTE